jgi:hypothetical protein
MGLKISIKGLDTATAQIQNAVKMGVQSALSEAGARGVVLVTEAIRNPYGSRPPAVATAILLHSITFQISQEAGISRAVVFAGAPADVYVDPVERGTRPHMPPPSALLLWVKKKFSPSTERQALSIAWAIAMNIRKRGTSAFKMFERAFAQLDSELPRIFDAQIARAIRAAGVGPTGASGTK